MRFEITLERTFAHPMEAVWHALTDKAALAQWLMETDFEPEAGRAFTMWCEAQDGSTDTYHCRVLEVQPPHRMSWSWVLAGREGEGATRVEFRLAEQDRRTTLTIVHSGDRDAATVERFRGGWPVKLAALQRVLGTEP